MTEFFSDKVYYQQKSLFDNMSFRPTATTHQTKQPRKQQTWLELWNKRQKKVEFQSDLTAKGAGTNLRSQSEGSDMNSCLDHAVKRLVEQLRKTADRRRFHRHRDDSVLSASDVSKLKGI